MPKASDLPKIPDKDYTRLSPRRLISAQSWGIEPGLFLSIPKIARDQIIFLGSPPPTGCFRACSDSALRCHFIKAIVYRHTRTCHFFSPNSGTEKLGSAIFPCNQENSKFLPGNLKSGFNKNYNSKIRKQERLCFSANLVAFQNSAQKEAQGTESC